MTTSPAIRASSLRFAALGESPSVSKMGGVPNVFSPQTLEAFEKAAASIPLRPLDRAFERMGIRLGADPGGPEGARRVQFRRYVATIDQGDSQQVHRLGAVLGALIDEVADSKQEYLVNAARRDGFAFSDGVFLPGDPALDEIGEAKHRLESVCRTILRITGEPAPGKSAGLVDIATAAIAAIARR